jgi:hypothetical protein
MKMVNFDVMADTKVATPYDVSVLAAGKENVVDKQIKQYMDAIPKVRKHLVDMLQALILDIYPNAEVLI